MQCEEVEKNLNLVFNPEGLQDAFTDIMRDEHTFVGAKRLADGTYVGVLRLIYTMAICIGTDEISAYRRRYCYDDLSTCLKEYEKLETGDDIPEGWIAKRPT